MLIAADRVTLTLSHLDLSTWASRDNCSSFHLEIRDGTDINAPLIGRYCSRSVPPAITSQVSFFLTFILTQFLSLFVSQFLSFFQHNRQGVQLRWQSARLACEKYEDRYPAPPKYFFLIFKSFKKFFSGQFTFHPLIFDKISRWIWLPSYLLC